MSARVPRERIRSGVLTLRSFNHDELARLADEMLRGFDWERYRWRRACVCKSWLGPLQHCTPDGRNAGNERNNNVTGWHGFKGKSRQLAVRGFTGRAELKYGSPMSDIEGILLLQHIKVVQQTRELVGAIRRNANQTQFSEESTALLLKGNYTAVILLCCSQNPDSRSRESIWYCLSGTIDKPRRFLQHVEGISRPTATAESASHSKSSCKRALSQEEAIATLLVLVVSSTS